MKFKTGLTTHLGWLPLFGVRTRSKTARTVEFQLRKSYLLNTCVLIPAKFQANDCLIPPRKHTHQVKLLALLVGLLVFFVAGCDSGPSLSTNNDAIAGNTSSVSPLPQAGILSHDERTAKLAKKMSGFGGVFFDDTGHLAVYLTDPSTQKATAQSVLSNSRLVSRSLSHLGAAEKAYGAAMKNFGSASVANMKVRQGQYTFLQLRSWKDQAFRNLFGFSGVYSIDIDESDNSLRIGVKNEKARERVQGNLANLNIPEKAVIIDKTSPTVRQRSLHDDFDTTGAGIQIAFGQYLCTMGPNVTWRDGNRTGFITNSHCTNSRGGVEGTDYYQPSTGDENDYIGREIRDPEYSSTLYNCPGGRDCRRSDAALIRYSSNSGLLQCRACRPESEKGLIYGPESRDPEDGTLEVGYEYYTDVVGGYNFEGYPQDKIGRTTGWTYGDLSSICVGRKVFELGPGGNPVDTGITLLCQNEVQAGSGGGDSGSPVFERRGGDVLELVGLLWGGRTTSAGDQFFVYSPIENIKDELTNEYDPDGIRLDFSADRCPPSNPYCNVP